MTENLCHSGGATGADLFWGTVATRHGHRVNHYLFKGHKGSNHPQAVLVDPEALAIVADPILTLANQVLKRSFPAHSEFVNNLLRRNYSQVQTSEAVYAVAGIDSDGIVIGGTAWAIECFKILHPNSDRIYVYDSWKDLWFQWDPSWARFNEMTSIPPRPSGSWTGIGTRDLDDRGCDAIEAVMDEFNAS